MTRLKKLTALAAAVALSGGLAACGGGGSSTTMMPDPIMCPDGQEPNAANDGCVDTAETMEMKALDAAQMAAQDAADAADTAADDAETAADAQTSNKAHDEASYTLAQNAADRARAASDDAAAANTAAQAATTSVAAKAQQAIAERHQQTAEAEKANAMKYAGMVLAAKNKADADATAAAAKEAANKVAISKRMAIATEGNEATAAARPFDLTGDTANPAADADRDGTHNYGLTVKHTGSAVNVTVVDGHMDYDAKNDPQFTRAASFGNGQMLVRNDGTAREIIVLHTDIEAPKDVQFGRTGSGYDLTVDVDSDTSANDSYLVVNADDASKLGGSRIVSPDPGTKILTQWEAMGDNADNVFPGTLDGAAGTFRCQDATCTVTTTAGATADDDNIVAVTGVLWFTPDAGTTVEIADSDYMTWGFWLDTTTKDGDIASYDTVQTFVTSNLDPTDETLADVTGTATYNGDAAGVYVHETKMEDGALDTATSGRFTADVKLMADFDGSTTRVVNSIVGTISNFDLDGGPANKWNVDVSAGITADFALENGVASGGVTGSNGSIAGQFHGTAADRDGDGAETNLAAPPVLVGEFNANFVNGSVAGAYGARAE